jgi:hypothetical protein
LTMDIQRQQRLPGFLCSNDAMQCYDRIVHNVAILSTRRLGLQKSTTESMFGALQSATHHILTGFGLSQEGYGGKERYDKEQLPLMGVGQGNGAGPAIWAAISTVLLEVMDSKGFGANLYGALTKRLCSLIGYAFVDDTDLVHTATDPNIPISSLTDKFQSAVDHWNGLLAATGGAIEPSKSFIYILDFKWTGKKWTYKNKTESPCALKIRSPHTGENEELTRLEPNEARKTLGIMIAMDGNQKAEVEFLRNKADIFANYIRCSALDKNDTWQALNTVFMKVIEYPMAAISLTDNKWDYVMGRLQHKYSQSLD